MGRKRIYFVGGIMPCVKCGADVVVTERMVRCSRAICTACNTRISAEWREAHKERFLDRVAARNAEPEQREKNKQYQRAYRECHCDEEKEYARKRRARDKEKFAARSAVQRALADGTLVKMPCERCGSEENVHAHHEDYERWLEVVWLCAVHHAERHREMNRLERTMRRRGAGKFLEGVDRKNRVC